MNLWRGFVGFLVLLVLGAAGAVTYLVLDDDASSCAGAVDPPRSPLQDPTTMKDQPNDERDKLAAALGALPAPFGPVAAGVGYYYDQGVHLYGVNGGLLAWTKNDAPVAFLDDASLTPRWSLRPTTSRTAWDTWGAKFLLLDLADAGPVKVGQFDLRTGVEQWCVQLTSHQRDGDPVATTFLDDGDVVTAFADHDAMRFTRLGSRTGATRWSHDLVGAGRSDYLGPLTDDLVVAGGDEEYRLANATAGTGGVLAFDAATGRRAWAWSGGTDTKVHVVGVADQSVLVNVRTANGSELVRLSAAGKELWRHPVPTTSDTSLRGDVVLARSRTALTAYDAATGEQRWQVPVPTNRTYFPYGFTLGQMPSLDAEHLLVPTTSSLLALDLRDGTSVSYLLPTDGVSTTYWPYQLLATPHHLGVVTNTGAVLATRE